MLKSFLLFGINLTRNCVNCNSYKFYFNLYNIKSVFMQLGLTYILQPSAFKTKFHKYF